MATQTGGLIQVQNLNIHFDAAAAPLGVKTSTAKAQKHGGLGGRRALNDISNSGMHSTIQTSKKHNSKNVIPYGEETGLSNLIPPGGKTKVSKAPEKVQAGGRKALSDLTNSGKPNVHQASKKKHDKKLTVVAEDQAILDGRFLHNHEKCIKEQRKTMDVDYFLTTVGLDNAASPQVSPQPMKSMPKSPLRYLEVEELPDFQYEDQSQWKKMELTSVQTPYGIKSPKPCLQWKDYDCPDFMLTETPRQN